MRTYQKIAQNDEQELLSKLLPMRILRAKQRTFWTINTNDITFELVAIGRIPKGVTITEEWSNASELDTVMLEAMGAKFNFKKIDFVMSAKMRDKSQNLDQICDISSDCVPISKPTTYLNAMIKPAKWVNTTF